MTGKSLEQRRAEDIHETIVRDIHYFWLQGLLKRDGNLIALALEDIASLAVRYFDDCNDQDAMSIVMTFQVKLDSCLGGVEDLENIQDLFVFLRDMGVKLQFYGYNCTASLCFQMCAMYGQQPAIDWPMFGIKAGEIMLKSVIPPPDDNVFGFG